MRTRRMTSLNESSSKGKAARRELESRLTPKKSEKVSSTGGGGRGEGRVAKITELWTIQKEKKRGTSGERFLYTKLCGDGNGPRSRKRPKRRSS